MNNDDDEMVEKIDLFLQILKVTRTSIDLGFLNSETIQKTIIYVIQIFQPFQGGSNNEIFIKGHWIHGFIREAINSNNDGELNRYIDDIMVEVSKLLRLFMQIKKNFQIINLLNNFCIDFESFSNLKYNSDLLQLS